MPIPRDYQFDLPAANRPVDVTIPEDWFPGVQNFWHRCTSPRSVGNHITGIRAIVIHATAGASSAGAVSVMNGRPAASFHWLVPDEDEPQHGRIIWACVRERDAAWHVRPDKSHPNVNGGQRRVNHWSLGVEIVNRQSRNGSDAFSDWQVAVTAQLVQYCWAKYPNLRHVVSHARLDPLRRTDPGSNFPWDEFKEMVLDVGQQPLNRVGTTRSASGDDSAGNPLDAYETGSEADEEANFATEEEADEVHDIGEE